MSTTDITLTAVEDSETTPLTPGQIFRQRLFGHTGFLIGASIILAIVVVAIFAPLIAPHDPYVQSLSTRMLPPVWSEGGSWEHLLGTDQNGRDYLSRLIYGTRVSITIGIGAATVGLMIGVTLGVMAGYFGGWIDHAISFLLTAQLALPGLLLAMALVFIIGPSIWVVIGIVGVLHWTYYLVVTRAATQRIRNLDFVAAAKASGASSRQIIWHEILPNLASSIIVIFTFELGIAILAESSLSFLGVGIQPPIPSWGLMIAEGKQAMFYRPWLVVLPGICLFLLVIGANLMGDGLRDITSPEGRNE
ncbi:peptide/nickel transport system permease protein [Pseudooceanicola antarcticus]|uniref:ABC transporter permease n=1 Tax=Pseudooceanicola antarcticus TaxID=1247613 RepID=A0A285JEQ6_9RHOB|nr:ABC transporter permease [Pseudooceanicola antarcticus]PJE31065.1 ABC transporter permease [Pseudooceanicola antarcticus]SNY58725.1 peptide/nickel transport system permease protein [Pseudooceanicola antarcticus]